MQLHQACLFACCLHLTCTSVVYATVGLVGTGGFGAKLAIVLSQSVLTCCGDLDCCCQVQVDLSTPSAMTATLRRNLMEFFDENHKEFVPGGGTVIYLDSQDPLKMTLGVVYTFSHNGALSSCCWPS